VIIVIYYRHNPSELASNFEFFPTSKGLWFQYILNFHAEVHSVISVNGIASD
jgi:hypothetical protein